MPEKLFEANSITTNLQAIFTAKKTDGGNTKGASSSIVSNPQTSKASETLPPKGQWKEYFQNKIDQNKALPDGQRLSDYAVETAFFKDYYSTEWGDEELATKLLAVGDLLRKVFKKLGFPKNGGGNNPFYYFLQSNQGRELLKSNLLNAVTFKAIYNAVVKKLVATSELTKENNYNIIYCKDLYRKSQGEIEDYLELQSRRLPATADGYTAKDLLDNKKVFLNFHEIKEQDTDKRINIIKEATAESLAERTVKNEKLNSIDFAEKMSAALGNGGKRKTAEKTKISVDAQAKITGKLNEPHHIFAAIQLLSMNTNSAKAKAALADKKFSNLTQKDIINATAWLAANQIIPNGQIATTDADAIVDILLGKLYF